MAERHDHRESGLPHQRPQQGRGSIGIPDLDDTRKCLSSLGHPPLPSPRRLGRGWALDERFAGVKGRGAIDALRIEEAISRGLHVTVRAADVFKCFDQLIRGVIYQLAALAGMPWRVLGAYQRFQEGMWVRNAVAGGWGALAETHE